MYVISISQGKGGVGKTTTAISLGAALVELGKRVLIIDVDPQEHVQVSFNSNNHEHMYGMDDVLLDKVPISKAIRKTSYKDLFYITAGKRIILAEQYLPIHKKYQKTIKNSLQEGGKPADVFTSVNAQLCENNEAGMFVTAWMAVYEISTGKLTFVNAGHNPPLIKRKDGSFEYLKSRAGFVLAGMGGMKYRDNENFLAAGDILYLYTDGVTEATSVDEQLFGEDRLKAVLDKNADVSLTQLLHMVKGDIDLFVNGAEQFDDITMLALKISDRSAAD